jgi:hypothetical protein
MISATTAIPIRDIFSPMRLTGAHRDRHVATPVQRMVAVVE